MNKLTVIFDLDGTLAIIDKRRQLAAKPDGKIHWGKFFDPENIKLDEPNHPVIAAFQAMKADVDDKVLTVKQKMLEIQKLENDDGLDTKMKAEEIRKIQAETKRIITEVVKIRQEMINAVDEDIKTLSEKEKQPEKSAA